MLINPQGIKAFIGEFAVFSHKYESLKINESKNHFLKLFSKFEEIDLRIKTENKEKSYLFNPLSFFEIGENKMSELLAFLLNPNASHDGHGQGNIYLREFCNLFGIDGNFQNAFVETEHVTDKNRRIDIFVKIDDRYIVIENKYMWAIDQNNQLNDYFDYARNKNPQFDGQNVYCFYLTPNKERKTPHNSDTNKIPEKNLRIVDFKLDIIPYLRNCREISNNKMQVFIDDLISLINEEDKMDQYKKEIFEWLSEDSSRVNHAQQIYDIWAEFRLFLLEKTVKQLIENINDNLKQPLYNNEEWEVMFAGDFRKAYSGIKITKKQWKEKYSLWLMSEVGQFNSLFLTFNLTNENNLSEEEMKMSAVIVKTITGTSSDSTNIAWKYSTIRDTWGDVDRFSRNNRQTTIDTWTNELMSFVGVLEQEDIKKNIIDLVGRIDS
jgi:hypothetical protein